MRTLLEREAQEALARLGREAARRHVVPARGIDFASNDYLGLRRDPRVVEAAARALREGGLGAGASRLLRGDCPAHRALEERMAAHQGAEDGLLFPSGFHANLGVLQALGREGWTIASDERNHASIVEGCRAARARTVVVAHGDAAAFAAAARDGRTIVVTESVFSMSGDLAPLDALSDACDSRGAALVVDEAHAVGVLPPRGRAVLRVSPCGKALGGAGAVVTGPRDVLDLLRSTCRTFLFTTALPPAVAAGVLAALEVALAEPWRAERALALARRLSPGAASPIVAVPCRDNADALAAQESLAALGLDVRAVRPPTVPRAILRVSVHAGRTEGEVDRLGEALAARRAGGRVRGVYVVGTDTGIGKTTYAASLCARHPGATYWKPVQTGWPEDDDTRTVAAPRSLPGVRLREPVSPHLAARREGVVLTLGRLLEPLRGFDGTLVAEGAGGLLVPLAPGLLQADLVAAVGLPVVVVARDRLGTINHTLLTLEALRGRGIAVAGVALLGGDRNREAIEAHGGVRVVDDVL